MKLFTVPKKMSDLNVPFENLKKNIARKLESSFDFEKVKECFSDIINSRRSLSRVKNLNDIFHLLQQRDMLNCYNVAILEYLADLSQIEDVQKLVRGYKKLYIDSDDVVCICGENITFILPIINPQKNSPKNKSDNDLQFAFHNIAMNIGKNWRVLASQLKIPECYVDEVRKKYPCDIYQQALNILQIWKEYNQEDATMELLKKALEARLCKREGVGLHMLKPVITI